MKTIQYNNVSYQSSDIYTRQNYFWQFDAIVGRRVLHTSDAEKCLQILKSILKPEGILCFQESDAINASVGTDGMIFKGNAIQTIWETVKQVVGLFISVKNLIICLIIRESFVILFCRGSDSNINGQ